MALALLVGLAMASPASAADWTLGSMGTKLGTGLNGILTSPADIVMGVMEGSSMTSVTGLTNLAGLFVGTTNMLVRAVGGAADLVTFFVPETAMISPKARYAVIPGTKMM